MRVVLAIIALLLAVSAYAVKFKISEEEQERINRLYFNTDAFCHVANRPKGAVFTCFTRDGKHYVFFSPGQA